VRTGKIYGDLRATCDLPLDGNIELVNMILMILLRLNKSFIIWLRRTFKVSKSFFMARI
jgi:hypothetical protein